MDYFFWGGGGEVGAKGMLLPPLKLLGEPMGEALVSVELDQP